MRNTTGSRLTPHGQLVVDWARTVLASASDLLSGVQALRRGREAALRVAASMTVAEYLMPTWLVAFARTAPRVKVSPQVVNSETVANLIRDGRADVGFIESRSIPGDVVVRRIAGDRLVVVVAPGHPWARRRRPVTAAELAASALVVREPGSGTREALDHALAGHDRAKPLLELSSNTAIKVAVGSGGGPAVLSILAVTAELHERRFIEVPIADLRLDRPLRAAWRGRRPTDSAAELVRIAAAVGVPA